MSPLNPRISVAFLTVSLAAARAIPSQTVTVTTGTDVKVTNDNYNVPGGVPNPGFDAQNLPQYETSVAVSPLDPNVVAVASIDFRLFPNAVVNDEGVRKAA